MILVVEPVSTKFEHVEVNAALIASLRSAFPDSPITFASREAHIRLVFQRLDQHNITEITEWTLNSSVSADHQRSPFFASLTTTIEICRLAETLHASKLLICTTTFGLLFWIKQLSKGQEEIEFYLIQHKLNSRPAILCSDGPLCSLARTILKYLMTGNKQCHLLVLAPHILKNFSRLLPGVENTMKWLDHPYFFDRNEPIACSSGRVIRFGTFGVGHVSKGTELFFRLAEEIGSLTLPCSAEFLHIGPLLDLHPPSLHNLIIPSPKIPLSREQMVRHADTIDYALFFYGIDSYRFAASGAFLDAASCLKPIIALRNDCFADCFRRLGDIGFLCRDYEEIKQTVINILGGAEQEHHKAQTSKLLTERMLYNPARVAIQLRAIMTTQQPERK